MPTGLGCREGWTADRHVHGRCSAYVGSALLEAAVPASTFCPRRSSLGAVSLLHGAGMRGGHQGAANSHVGVPLSHDGAQSRPNR